MSNLELCGNKTFLGLGVRAVAIAAALAVSSGLSTAQDLKGDLTEMLKTHPRLDAARNDIRSAESKVSETFRRAWTPNVDVTGEKGTQKYESLSNDKQLDYSRATLRATQQIFDFGRTSRQVGENEAVLNQSKALAAASESGLMLEAISAHWSYIRAGRILDFSRQSEESVRRQANVESSLVELGKGYESNVLQAKVQLTSAEARRLRAEGALDIARSRVKALFGNAAGKMDYNNLAVVSANLMPKTLDEALTLALQNNQQIKVGMHRSQAIQERLSATRAKEFLPRLNVVAETSRRFNTDGVENARSFGDQKVYVQFLYNFNAGGAGSKALDVVGTEYAASVARELETRQLVEEQVSISWRNVQVATENRQTLSNLVRIAAKFYELAVAERQMGRRSLLEVLSAELSLTSALSDLLSTEVDVAIASLTLMQSVGKLDMNSFEMKPAQSVLPKI